MFDEFAKNIVAAQGGGNMYDKYNAFKIDASPAQFAGKHAAIQANNDDIARANAKAQADAEAAQAAKRAEDDQKAVMRLKPDGHGYDFFTGTGKPININQFSMMTGKRPDEILANSDDPRDQKFVNDYKTMSQFAGAWINGDNKTLQKLREADPKKFNDLIKTYKSPRDMVDGFTSYYSDYYGGTQGKQDKAQPFSYSKNPTGPANDPTGKAIANRIAGSPLSQTLSPLNNLPGPGKPGGEGNILTDNIFTHNPISNMIPGTFGNKIEDFNARRKKEEESNPWYAYHNYLMGR